MNAGNGANVANSDSTTENFTKSFLVVSSRRKNKVCILHRMDIQLGF